MDLWVTGGGRVTEADGELVERGGDTLMSSYHMFTMPYIMLHQRLYVLDLSTIVIHFNQ